MPWTHHSHSGQFCRHAKGSLAEVVREAYDRGFELFCLSEHMPRFRKQDLYPEESDLTIENLSGMFDKYIQEAVRLKEKYKKERRPMDILIGLETDVIHSGSLTELETVLSRHKQDIDFIVGSVHHVKEIPIDFDRKTFEFCLAQKCDGDLGKLMAEYFDLQYNLMQAAQPEIIGHFDLCRLYLPDTQFRNFPEVWAKIDRNVKYAIAYGALFEVNAAAFRKGWQSAYPGPDVLQLILSRGGKFCLSDDSHGPQAIALHYTDAWKYLQQQGISSLYRLIDAKGISSRRKTAAVPIQGNWAKHAFFPQPS